MTVSDGDHDGDAEGDPRPKPVIPLRPATPQQAMLAITFVFFVGVLIGFALGRTL